MTTLHVPPNDATVVPATTPPVVSYQPRPPRKFRTMEQVSRTEKSIAYILLILGSIAFLIPFYFVLNASLKAQAQVEAGDFVSVPASLKDVKLSNYPRALAPDKMNFWPALSNTVVITTLSVVGQVISCSLVGFGFARFKFRGRGILFMIMLSTLMLPAQVVMIPVFILFRSLGMIDTF